MKKLLFLLLLPVMLWSCSSDDEPEVDKVPEGIKKVWQALDGTYSTTFELMNTGKDWYSEKIVFHPYSERKIIVPPYTYINGDVYAYGTAEIYDTRYLDINEGVPEYCYYSINANYSGGMEVAFFEFNTESGYVIGREDSRTFRVMSASEIELNGQIYKKQ